MRTLVAQALGFGVALGDVIKELFPADALEVILD
jgi:hypothetical protein